MSKFILLSDTFGYHLAHAGETHETAEEEAGHRQTTEETTSSSETQQTNEQDTSLVVEPTNGFEPPIIESEFVTGLIIVLLTALIFIGSQFITKKMTIRFVVSMVFLIVAGALYVITAPTVTAITVGFGFFTAFLITLLGLSAS